MVLPYLRTATARHPEHGRVHTPKLCPRKQGLGSLSVRIGRGPVRNHLPVPRRPHCEPDKARNVLVHQSDACSVSQALPKSFKVWRNLYRSKIFPESSLLRYASWSCSLDVLSRTASILPSPHVSPLSSELWLGTLRLTLGSTLAKAGLLHLPCTSRSSSLTARLERPATGHRRARIRSAAVGRSREHVEATGESRDPHPRRPEGARGGRAAPRAGPGSAQRMLEMPPRVRDVRSSIYDACERYTQPHFCAYRYHNAPRHHLLRERARPG